MSEYFDSSLIVLSYQVADQDFQVTFSQLDQTMKEFIQFAIIHGLAIGIGSLLMFLSWVIVINKRTPIFIMNQCSLLLLVIRSGLYLGYVLGSLSQLAYIYTGIFNGSWDAYNLSMATNVVFCFLVMSAESTMVFQVYVMFKSSKQKYLGNILTSICGVLGITVVGLYVNASANASYVLKSQLTNKDFVAYGSWVANLPIILFSSTVNILSIILILKLAVAIRTRRFLGMKQFDSFHILIIMITQTFIIPSTLVIVNYKNTSTNFLSSLSFILAVCNLPLGSLWATSSNNNVHPTSASNTVLSRYDSSVSSHGTLAVKEDMILNKYVTPHTTDLEMSATTPINFDYHEVDSLERILENFEDRGVVSVTTNAFK